MAISRIKTLILLFIFITGCASARPINTDKIHLFFGEEGNNAEIVAENNEIFPLYITTDIKNMIDMEIYDVSSNALRCTNDIIKSPAKIASYSFNPKKNVNKITFNIRLPCASYHNKFYIMIKVKSLTKDFMIRKRIPILITRESPGYFQEGYKYSGTLP